MSSRASKHRQKRRQRVGVWLQRQVATLAGRIILLLAGIVIVTVAGNTVMYFSLDAFSSYDDALWWTMDHLFDPGALNEDRGWAQRLVGLALVAAGLIILVGILVTLATEVVERSLERLASADLPVDVRQHLLFVGWDDTTPDILQTLDYLQPHLLGGNRRPFAASWCWHRTACATVAPSFKICCTRRSPRRRRRSPSGMFCSLKATSAPRRGTPTPS